MGCDRPIDERAPACWGGLIVLGRSTLNTLTGTGQAEGISEENGSYGGQDENDDSGTLRFVRVEFGGRRITDVVEPNAFGFHGVGRGTKIDYIQALEGGDDGVEFFGGTAEAKHVVITGSVDDELDWTFGWRGKLQHVFIRQGSIVECDEPVEADNNSDGNDFMPRSNPTIYNATFIGDEGCGGRGMLIREGTGLTLRNSLVAFSPGPGAEINGAPACAQRGNGIRFNGVTFWANSEGDTSLNGQFAMREECSTAEFAGTQSNIVVMDPRLRKLVISDPDPRPLERSHVGLIGASVAPPDDGFFEGGAQHHGAFDPNQSNWLDEWTNFVRPADVQ